MQYQKKEDSNSISWSARKVFRSDANLW